MFHLLQSCHLIPNPLVLHSRGEQKTHGADNPPPLRPRKSEPIQSPSVELDRCIGRLRAKQSATRFNFG